MVIGTARIGQVIKVGEYPPFGPITPTRLFRLIGEDHRVLYLKGRRSENRGLGIGAYAYYRRIVEDQKFLLIEEIQKVAQKLGATKEELALFTDARTQRQFKTAIDTIKDVIPKSLLISGQNPLSLLHDALSEGIHELTDEECLERASHVRVLLTELAERVTMALKENTDLQDAVKGIMNRNAPKNTP